MVTTWVFTVLKISCYGRHYSVIFTVIYRKGTIGNYTTGAFFMIGDCGPFLRQGFCMYEI